MKKSRLWRRLLAGLLSVSMVAGNLSTGAFVSYAQETETAEIIEETSDEILAVEEASEDVSQDTSEDASAVSEEAAETAADSSSSAEDNAGILTIEDVEDVTDEEDLEEIQTDVATDSGTTGTDTEADTEVTAEADTETTTEAESELTTEIEDESETETEIESESESDSGIAALTEDEAADVTIDEDGEVQWFQFTPSKSGTYSFTSSGSYDTYAQLYTDPEGEAVAESDDISSSNRNFSVEYALTAGETYYLAAQMCYDYIQGSFTVTVSWENYAIESITFTPGQTVFYYPIDSNYYSNLYYGITADVVYTDGSTESLSYNGSSYSSKTGKYLNWSGNYQTTTYNGFTVLKAGTWTMTLSYMTETYTYDIEVKDFTEIGSLPESGTVTGDKGESAYYKFTAEESGFYAATYDYSYANTGSYWNYYEPVVYDSDGSSVSSLYSNTQYISSESGTLWMLYNLEAGETYYIKLRGYYYYAGDEYQFSLEKWETQNISEPVTGSGDGLAFYSYTPEEDGVATFTLTRGVSKTYEEDDGYEYYEYYSVSLLSLIEFSASDGSCVSYSAGSIASSSSDSEGYHTNYLVNVTAGTTYVMVVNSSDSDATYSVEVSVGKALTGIAIAQMPTKTSYTTEDTGVDYSGLAITVSYADGTSETISYGSTGSQGTGFSISLSSYIWDDNGEQLSAGEYGVTVTYLGYTASFTITVTEAERTISQALTVDSAYTDTFSGTGETSQTKYYSLTVEESGFYYISVSIDTECDGYASRILYDSEDATVSSYGNVYYLYADETYVMRVRFYSYEEGTWTAELTTEVSQENQQTLSVENGAGAASGTLASYSSTYYVFSPDESGTYTLNVSYGSAYGYAYLYGSSGYLSSFSGSYDDDDNFSRYLSRTLTAGEWYLVRLTSDEEDDCAFTFSVEKNASATESAIPLTVDQDGVLVEITAESTAQWFSFTPESSGTYVIYSSYSEDYSDSYVQLYQDNDYTYVTSNDDGGTGLNFSLSYYLVAGVTYYYKTTLLDDDYPGSFYVYFEQSSSSSNPEDAIELTPDGDAHLVEIEEAGDVQWFSYTPEETDTYVIYSTDGDGSYDTYVELYQESTSNYISSNDDGGSSLNFRLAYELTAGVTYYYKTRMLSSSVTGSFYVHFETVKTPASIEITAYPQTEYYSYVTSSLNYSGLTLEITYEDGSTEELVYGNSSEYGLYMSISTPDDLYTDSGALAGGEHTITVYLGSCTATYTIEVKTADDIEDELTEGVKETGTDLNNNGKYWKFTASESGLYSILVSASTEGSYYSYPSLSVADSEGNTQSILLSRSSSYYPDGSDYYYYYHNMYYSLTEGVTYVISASTSASADRAYEALVYKVSEVGVDGETLTDENNYFGCALVSVEESGFYTFENTSSSSYTYYNMYLYSYSGSALNYCSDSMYNTYIRVYKDSSYVYKNVKVVYLEAGDYLFTNYYYGTTTSTPTVSSLSSATEIPYTFDTATLNGGEWNAVPVTSSESGEFTFTFEGTYTGSHSNTGFRLLNADSMTSIGTVTQTDYSYVYADGVYTYTYEYTIGAELEAGTTYILLAYADSILSLTAEESSEVSSIELVSKPTRTTYYYKLDNITSSTSLYSGSSLKVTYTDGTEETISGGSYSSTTGFTYTMTLPEDASYDSSGYLRVGTYQANVTYMDKTITTPITMKSVASMPYLSLDENGQGSYTGELEDLSSTAQYGYIRFRATEDGFYNLTFTADSYVYVYYNAIFNASYGSMDYTTSFTSSSSKWMRDTTIYVKKGQSCYIRYYYYSYSSGSVDSSFTFSVDMAADQSIQELECGVQAEVSSTASTDVKWFSFTPETSGTYIVTTQDAGSYYPYIYLYTSPDSSSYLTYSYTRVNGYNAKLSYSMTAGTTYYYRLYNFVGTIGLTLVKSSTPVSIELLTEGEIYCSSLPDYTDRSFADLEFRITYSDGTTEDVPFGYYTYSGSYGGYYTNLHGYTMGYDEPDWEYDDNGYIIDQEYTVTFTCGSASLDVAVIARSIQDLDELAEEFTETIAAGKYIYYQFTPDESGYYRFTVSSASSYADLAMFDAYMVEVDSEYSNSYYSSGSYYDVKVFELDAETTYCLRLGNTSGSEISVTCANELISPATSISIETYPQTTYYLGVDSQYSTTGLSIGVTYEDGSTETIAAGSRSETTGLAISTTLSGNSAGNMYLGSTGTKTITVSYMGVSTSYSISVLDVSSISEMTTDTAYSGSLTSAQNSVYVKIVAEETGFYQISLTGEYDEESESTVIPVISSVLNSTYASQTMKFTALDSDTYTRQTVVYLLAGKTYYVKGYLTDEDGDRAAGSYTASIALLSDLSDGVAIGELAAGKTEAIQFTVSSTGYYRFALDADEDTSVSMLLYNSGFGSISLEEGSGTKTGRTYYVARLQAGYIYAAALTNGSSSAQEYTLYAGQKADVESISVVQTPEKTLYYSQFDNSISGDGLVILISYSDGTSEELTFGEKSSWGIRMTISASGITTDSNGNYEAGDWSVICTYLEQTTTFDITVQDFDAESVDALTAETATEIEIPAGESVFYSFTPDETKEYRFYSRGDEAGIYGYIYTEDGTLVASDGSYTDTEFSVTATLTAGETYILRVRNPLSDTAITTTIKLHDTSLYTEVTGVSLSSGELVFGGLNQTAVLTAAVSPDDAEYTGVTWSIDDDSIASVDEDGTVTSLAEGTATVTVTTEDGGYTAKCTVIVDLQAPEVTAVYPTDGSKIGPSANTLYIYASDDNGIAEAVVEYKSSEDTEYQTVTSSDLDEDSSHNAVVLAEIPLDDFSDGDTVDVRVTVVDKGGNESEAAERSYTVDKQAPEITDLAGEWNTETLAVDLTWTGGMESDISSYMIYRKAQGTADSTYTYLGTVTGYVNLEDYSYSDTTVANAEGQYTYKVTANDKYGNSQAYTVDVDTTYINEAPSVVLNCDSTIVSGETATFDLSESTDDSGITKYEIDFGDGSDTESAESADEAVFEHTYTLEEDETEAEYTVTVTVTDDDEDALTDTFEKTIRVVDLDSVGMVTVYVVDTDGVPIANMGVYFDMGEDDMVKSTTDRTGAAEFTALPGMYLVGAYLSGSGYIPVTDYVELEAGEITELTLVMEEGELVTGEFESHKMSLDEIEAVEAETGADLTGSSDNYHVVEWNVTLTYSTLNVYCGDSIYITGGNDGYIYAAQAVDEILVIIEIPVTVSILKEFFSVNLYIMNNGSEGITLTDNKITLNVPDGLTVMEDAYNAAQVEIDSIAGGATEVIQWIVRGDVSGEYYLSADYSGTLAGFNETVTASFTCDDPLKVYGVDNLEVTMQIPDSFTDGTFFYNLIMANTAEAGDDDANMYLPQLTGEGELVQTMLNKEDGTTEYLSEMPEVLRAAESIEKFYIITDQISEQLAQYPDYEDFVFYFKKAVVEELTSYGVTLNIEVVDAATLAAKYEQYRALPATDVELTVDDDEAVYGASEKATITVAATAATNAEYTLAYEWYDTYYDPVGTGETFTLPSGLDAGTYYYHCVVVSTRTDNGNMAQTEYYKATVIVSPKEVEITWSGTETRTYDGTPSDVTATLTNLETGDTCELTVEGGTESDAGEHTATITELDNANYALPENASTTYTIDPLTAELEWTGAGEREYDGTASNVEATVTNLVTVDESTDVCTVTVENGTETDAGTYTATATELSNPNYQLPTDGTEECEYTITPKTVTPVWSGNETRTYDGEASDVTATIDPDDLIDGDTCDVIVEGGDETDAGTWTATATEPSNPNYQLPVVDETADGSEDSEEGSGEENAGDGSESSDEDASSVTRAASTTYTIEKLTAELTWSGTETRTYDGTASDVQAVVSNLVTADETTDVCLVTVEGGTEKNAGTWTATATGLTGADSGNYQLPDEDAVSTTYIIEQLTAELEWSGTETRIYDGTASDVRAAVANLVTVNEVTDECDVTVEDGTEKDAGTWTATAVSLSNTNYKLPDEVTASYEITQKPIAITWSGSDARTYDGTASNVTAEADADALEEGDTCEVTVTGGSETDAGTYTATAELGNSNYQIADNSDSSMEYTIEKKTVALVWSGTEERTYDGTASSVTADVLADSLVDGDTCEVTVTGGDETDAGTYTAVAAGLDNANYQLPDTSVEGNEDAASASYTIAKLEAELTWTGTEKTYDGEAADVQATVENLVTRDDGTTDECTVTVTGGNEINAGTYIATATVLSNSNYSLPGTSVNTENAEEAENAENEEGSEDTDDTGDAGDNEELAADSDAASTVYTINKRTAELTWTGTEKTYDGTAPDVQAAVSNLVEGDDCSVAVTVGDETSVGTYTATAAELTGESAENYELPEAATTNYTISPKTVELIWSNADTRAYDGTASTVTASVSEESLIGEEVLEVTVTGGDEVNAGTYTATAEELTGDGAENYTLPSDPTQEYTINPKSVTITWSGTETRTYDGTASDVTAVLADASELIEGDSCEVTVTGGAETDAGTYTATAALSNSNYEIAENASVSYTIEAAETESGNGSGTEGSGSSTGTDTEGSGDSTGTDTEGSGNSTGTETEGSGSNTGTGTESSGSSTGTDSTGDQTGTDAADTQTGTGASVGSVYTDDTAKYTVTASGTSGNTVTVTGPASKNATSVSIPATVTINGVEYKVTAIGESAFANCTSLETVSVGGNITVIEAKAFYKCTSLKSLSGCSEVVSIGASAFSGCKKLTSVDGMTKLTTIGSKAFYNCSKLTTIGSKKSAITLASIVTIGSKAFYNCKAVTKANLTSKSLTSIGTSAFQKCTAMKSFTSKSTVLKTIGKKAFYGDKKLAKVTLKTKKLTKSSVKANAFKGIKSTCTFKVPSAKVSAYKSIFKARGASKSIKVKK
ncbi:MAG: leucine-rich repeat protein [Lachnospiraceae bacterium]|nr:leucine-rich repeat protein [Lachnospiraceae bacterium]